MVRCVCTQLRSQRVHQQLPGRGRVGACTFYTGNASIQEPGCVFMDVKGEGRSHPCHSGIALGSPSGRVQVSSRTLPGAVNMCADPSKKKPHSHDNFLNLHRARLKPRAGCRHQRNRLFGNRQRNPQAPPSELLRSPRMPSPRTKVIVSSWCSITHRNNAPSSPGCIARPILRLPPEEHVGRWQAAGSALQLVRCG